MQSTNNYEYILDIKIMSTHPSDTDMQIYNRTLDVSSLANVKRFTKLFYRKTPSEEFYVDLCSDKKTVLSQR